MIINLLDKRYAILDGQWFEVPEKTTIEQVREYWIPDTSYRKKENPKEGKWEVKSYKGDKKYTVTFKNGAYSCTCIGFQYRRNCKHIEHIKSENERRD